MQKNLDQFFQSKFSPLPSMSRVKFVENFVREIFRSYKRGNDELVRFIESQTSEYPQEIALRLSCLISGSPENFNNLSSMASRLDSIFYEFPVLLFAASVSFNVSYDKQHIEKLSQTICHHPQLTPPFVDDLLTQFYLESTSQIIHTWCKDLIIRKIHQGCPRLDPTESMERKARPFMKTKDSMDAIEEQLKNHYGNLCEISMANAKKIVPGVMIACDSFESHYEFLDNLLFYSTTFVKSSSVDGIDAAFVPQKALPLRHIDLVDAVLAKIAESLSLLVPLNDEEWLYPDDSLHECWVISLWTPKVFNPLMSRVPGFYNLSPTDLLQPEATILNQLYDTEEMDLFKRFTSYLNQFTSPPFEEFCKILNKFFDERYLFEVSELLSLLFLNGQQVDYFLKLSVYRLESLNLSLEVVFNWLILKARRSFIEQLFSEAIAKDVAFWLCSSPDFTCNFSWLVDTSPPHIIESLHDIEIPVLEVGLEESHIEKPRMIWTTLRAFQECTMYNTKPPLTVFPAPRLKGDFWET
ncbi:hypothetical protein P9112_006580 [Eukaryota sp. TZLM1-RC]